MRDFIHPFVCAFRDLLGVAPPKLHDAMQQISINEDLLREQYTASDLSSREDDFVLYRIIGNDLPPRHELGQSLRSLSFILQNEPQLSSCTKKFVINRVLDTETESKIIATLEGHGHEYIHIPFDPDVYVEIPLDYACLPGGDADYLSSRSFRRLPRRHQIRFVTAVNRLRNNYVMHNNGARNVALRDGLGLAKWVLPFDGNCFFSDLAWEQFRMAVVERPWLKYFTVPMARIQSNADLLDTNYNPIAEEEPQIAFRCDTEEMFNEAFPYGRFPKIEMFWRLGIPGPWSYTVEKAGDQRRRPRSTDAFQCGIAAWVARLDSGVQHLEQTEDRGLKRGDARREAILDLLARLDLQYKGSCEFSRYRP